MKRNHNEKWLHSTLSDKVVKDGSRNSDETLKDESKSRDRDGDDRS